MPGGCELFPQFINISATARLLVIVSSVTHSANGSQCAHALDSVGNLTVSNGAKIVKIG